MFSNVRGNATRIDIVFYAAKLRAGFWPRIRTVGGICTAVKRLAD